MQCARAIPDWAVVPVKPAQGLNTNYKKELMWDENIIKWQRRSYARKLPKSTF
jgi:hypothetical protein